MLVHTTHYCLSWVRSKLWTTGLKMFLPKMKTRKREKEHIRSTLETCGYLEFHSNIKKKQREKTKKRRSSSPDCCSAAVSEKPAEALQQASPSCPCDRTKPPSCLLYIAVRNAKNCARETQIIKSTMHCSTQESHAPLDRDWLFTCTSNHIESSLFIERYIQKCH